MLFHYFLASTVIHQSYYCSREVNMSFSSLAPLKFFSSQFFLSSFTVIFPKVVFFAVILLEFHRAFEYMA